MKPRYKILTFSLFICLLFFSLFFLIRRDLKRCPDIVFITVDALRPDHLGCYGYSGNTSPNIDELAREGVLFTQAIAQSSLTFSSMPSIFTSSYPSTHGIEELKEEVGFLNPHILSLSRVLKDRGYFTAAVSGHGLIFCSIPGFDSGFDFIQDILNAPANEVTQYALKWLQQNQGKRFFLWVHYMDPHTPYQPPSPYDKLYLPSGLKEERKETLAGKYEWVPYEWTKGKFVFFPKQSAAGALSEEDKNYYISQYDGEISFVDEQIGVFLKELKKSGLDKNIFVIFASDHGENLADHSRYFGHGNSLYDTELKVPLIIKGKRIPKGEILNQQVQTIDIMPTLLDFLGVNSKYMNKLEGVSLLPLIRNKNKKYESHAFSEVRVSFKKNRILKSIRTKDWKLIHNLVDNKYELYHLKNDPEEKNNLIDSEKEIFESLKRRLGEWTGRLRPVAAGASKPLAEDTKKSLRNLGYLQ